LFAGGEGLGSFSTFLEGKKEKGLSLCLQSNHCAIFKNQNKTKKTNIILKTTKKQNNKKTTKNKTKPKNTNIQKCGLSS